MAAFVLCLTGAGLAVLSFAAKPAADSLDRKNGGKTPGLVQTGSGWSVFTSPSPGSGQNNLSGVTCATAVDCWAVGNYGNIGGTGRTLIEKWDGNSWSVVSSPDTSPTETNYLQGVTCVSASDCWAVGTYYDGSFTRTLIERWDGATWSIVASPNTSATQTNVLDGVACSSTNACWAAGYYYNGSFNQTLIEKWDGVSWSIVSSANNGTTRSNNLSDVACASANNCWAVGSYNAGTFNQTLILSWDGVAWISRSAPNLDPTHNSGFSGVTCVSDNDCWAVGSGQSQGILPRTLIARWQGGLWEIVSSPNATDLTHSNGLSDVTCTAADNCWAVGYADLHPPNHTMIQRWNGADWSLVSSPNVGNSNNIIQSVACAAAYECWTAGYYANPDPTTGTLIEGRFGLEIISVARLANNHKLVNCIGIPGQVNNLQASPDLNPAHFVTVSPPPPAADSNGAFQYEDANPGSRRFYRLAFP